MTKVSQEIPLKYLPMRVAYRRFRGLGICPVASRAASPAGGAYSIRAAPAGLPESNPVLLRIPFGGVAGRALGDPSRVDTREVLREG